MEDGIKGCCHGLVLKIPGIEYFCPELQSGYRLPQTAVQFFERSKCQKSASEKRDLGKATDYLLLAGTYWLSMQVLFHTCKPNPTTLPPRKKIISLVYNPLSV